MRFWTAFVLVTLCGFIALSYEILWFRVYSFVSGGSASSFALLLGFYLVGIAFGALWSRHYCRELDELRSRTSVRILSMFVLAANLAGFLVIPAVANLVRFIPYVFTFPILAAVSAFLGSTFPLISHVGIANLDKAGARLSYLYIGNILGSASGSLITGFLLMEYWSLPKIAICIAALGLALGAILIFSSEPSAPGRITVICSTGVAILLLITIGPTLLDRTYEKLLFQKSLKPNFRFAHIVENRSGVITVTPDRYLYGGGAYDGVYDLDLKKDRNVLERAYALGALHPSPEDVLMIGLGSGSWALVVGNHPAVRRLTIVEINPGYIDLLRKYPDHAALLRDSKVEFVVDDGRRWLRRNPDQRFDAIVANTTWNWRMLATNLLSREFLELIRLHLKEGGIYFYNTTGSLRALRTGAIVFPQAVRFMNCLAVSDTPFHFHLLRWRNLMSNYQINGRPVFDLSVEADQERLEELLGNANGQIETREKILLRTEGKAIITDDNMGTEWTKEQ